MSEAAEVAPKEGYPGPLAGVRILDLTAVVMGPLATQALADLGAEVIKLEPLAGDVTRGIGPGCEVGLGSHFVHVNRNKRSIALDLKTAAGMQAALAIADTVDVLVYNVRPAAMRRLGFDYDELAKRNPRLIYVGLVGYSQRGPNAAEPAFDDSIQSMSGIAHAMGEHLGQGPRFVPFTVADRAVGMYAFGVISAALYQRERTGRGQKIDVPMFETMTSLVLGEHLFGHSFEPPKGDYGYPRLLSDHRRPYRTSDGWLSCTVYSDAQWRSFLELAGFDGLYESDPRFATISSRTAHIDSLYELVGTALAKRTTAEWVAELEARDIPSTPVRDFAGIVADEHLQAIGFFDLSEHPLVGTLRQMNCPSEWSDAFTGIRLPPPALGEHSREILSEAGLSGEEIDELSAAGIVAEVREQLGAAEFAK